MRIVCQVMFALGLCSYCAALFYMGSASGEIYSDIGTALLLTTAVLLLFRLQPPSGE